MVRRTVAPFLTVVPAEGDWRRTMCAGCEEAAVVTVTSSPDSESFLRAVDTHTPTMSGTSTLTTVGACLAIVSSTALFGGTRAPARGVSVRTVPLPFDERAS